MATLVGGLADVRAAEAERWTLEPEDCVAEFRTRLFRVATITGRFDEVVGMIDIDRRRGVARIDTAVVLASLSMGNPRHVSWALSEDFFDAGRHPEARFRAEDVPLGMFAGGGVLHGTLLLRGVRRPAAFQLVPVGCPLDASMSCRIELVGTLRRSEFGMLAERRAVADRIQLRIVVSGRSVDDGAGALRWPAVE
jgi:polyisoprenoid-binding protein YceI